MAESGLYYLRARYYDPTTAQFMSRDPLVAVTMSPYAYVSGNPPNATDPTGLCSGFDLGCRARAVADAARNASRWSYDNVAVPVSGYTTSHVLGACANVSYNSRPFNSNADWNSVNGGSTCWGISGNGVGTYTTPMDAHGFSNGFGVNINLQDATSVKALDRTRGQIVDGGVKAAEGDLSGNCSGAVTGADFGYGVGIPASGYSGTTNTIATGWNWWNDQ